MSYLERKKGEKKKEKKEGKGKRKRKMAKEKRKMAKEKRKIGNVLPALFCPVSRTVRPSSVSKMPAWALSLLQVLAAVPHCTSFCCCCTSSPASPSGV